MKNFETKKFVNKKSGAIYLVDTPECLYYYQNSSEYEELKEEIKQDNSKVKKTEKEN